MTSTTLKAIGQGERTKPTNFPMMLDAYKNEIARALPRHLNAETMMRIALTCFRMNPKLAECEPASVFACVVQASQLGLRPGLMGECYLIPYKDQCTLQIGYQGLLELVRRSGLVEDVAAYVVRQGDEFDVEWGTTPGIKHKPFLDGDAGDLRLVYAVARMKGGGVHAELMTIADIEKIRARSQNVQNASRYGKKTPWDTDFDEMARKTVLRRICKYLPKSPDLASALALDDAASRGTQTLSMQDAIGNTFVPPVIEIDQDTGEINPPPNDAAPRNGRPRKASPEDPAAAASQAQEAEKNFALFAESIERASNLEAAALMLDEARHVLDPEPYTRLTEAYREKWA